MSKRFGLGLSRKSSDKRCRLSGSQFIPPTQLSLNNSKSSPKSPPLIEDDNDDTDLSDISFKEPQFNSTRIDNNASQPVLRTSQLKSGSQHSFLQHKNSVVENTKKKSAKTFFQDVLEKNGILFKPEEDVHTSRIEANELITKIREYFKNDLDYPYNVDEFLSSFKKYITDKARFKKLLTGSILLPEENSPILEHVQMSILQMLLRIDFIQTKLINILFDELITYVLQENISGEMYWIRSILGQFRELESFEDGENLLKRLFAIIETSGDNELAQHELIWSLPQITPDNLHNSIALELSRILQDNFSLTNVILDNLGCLWLSPNVRAQIDDQILELLKADAPLEKMHNFTKYLMWRCNPENAQHIITGLRANLDWGPLVHSSDEHYKAERFTSQVLTFGIIRDSLRNFLIDIWSKLLFSYQSHKDIKPFDIIMIFLLCITSVKRKQYFFTITCKRIIDSILRPDVLEKTFKDYYPVFKDNFQEFIILFTKFLKSKYTTVSAFGGLCYKFYLYYQDDSSNTPAFSSHITKTVLIELVQLVKFSETTCTIVLTVLLELCANHARHLCHNAVLLNKLLYSINSMTVAQVRMAMNILCSAAFPLNEQNSGFSLQDDIRIYTPKWLSSFLTIEKRKGIVCCVAVVQHIAKKHLDNNSEISSAPSIPSVENSQDLPQHGKCKDAASMIDSMFMLISGYPNLEGMAYDELASMVQMHHSELDHQFSSWLCNRITNDFKRFFTTEKIANEVLNGCHIKEMFCINERNHKNHQALINIAPVVFKCYRDCSAVNISALSPLFRLLRLLKVESGSNLNFVNTILDYGVAMPVVEDLDDFEEISFEQRSPVLDCIFHCINWFRELISAFLFMPEMEQKVLKRLKSTINMEKKFHSLLSLNGLDYKPPSSNFHKERDLEVAITKKPPKKGGTKKAQNKDTIQIEDTTTANPQANIKNHKPTIDPCGKIFRAYDNSLIILLKKKLLVSNKEESITMDEMSYVLQNVIYKLETLNGKSKLSEEQNFMEAPEVLMKEIIPIIPNVLENFNEICNILVDVLKECDYIKDANVMYFEKTMQAKTCLFLLQKFFSSIFGWTGFTISKNKPLFKELLGGFPRSGDSEEKSMHDLVVSAANFFLGHRSVIITLPCAANLIKILNALTQYIEDNDLESKLITLSHEFLSEEWYDETGAIEKGRNSNLNLEIVLKNYFHKADVKKIVQNVNWLREEIAAADKKKYHLKTFPCFHKSNFPLLYRNVFHAFIQAVRDRILKPLSSTQHLRFWEAIMNTLGKLMLLAKEQDSKIIINIFIKQSPMILKIFLKQGLSGLEVLLRNNTEDVTNILKTMQQSTRFINSICVQAKTTKDVALMSCVPTVLRILETIVYKVKAVLVANKCPTAFIMGNLINRNVKGEIIATQSTSVTESNNDSEDEFPPSNSESELESGSEPEECEKHGKNRESRSNLY